MHLFNWKVMAFSPREFSSTMSLIIFPLHFFLISSSSILVNQILDLLFWPPALHIFSHLFILFFYTFTLCRLFPLMWLSSFVFNFYFGKFYLPFSKSFYFIAPFLLNPFLILYIQCVPISSFQILMKASFKILFYSLSFFSLFWSWLFHLYSLVPFFSLFFSSQMFVSDWLLLMVRNELYEFPRSSIDVGRIDH